MSAIILDGRACASELLEFLKPMVETLDPKLVVVQVGDDPASESYIKQKFLSCEKVGMRHDHRHLPESTTLEKLLQTIGELNEDADVSGFIVQLPLPEHLTQSVPQVMRAIWPSKDVDGFTAYNLGKTFLSKEFEHLPPATPAGVIHLLEYYDIPIKGRDVTVIGHGNVGKPLAVMLINRNATVTVCHIDTRDATSHSRSADILISAVGKPGLVTKDFVKEGAVVIDIGITRVGDKLCGDVDFDAVKEVASAITPVPGGVGPMTVASLIRNCVTAKERQLEGK